jgi:hypothetical protein
MKQLFSSSLIVIQLGVQDVASVVDALGLANPDSVRKTVLVFSTMCVEMKALMAEAEKNYYGPLSLYGEGGETIFSALRRVLYIFDWVSERNMAEP